MICSTRRSVSWSNSIMRKLKTNFSQIFVPLALCAMGVGLLCLSGCRKREEAKPSPPDHYSPSVYMKDQAFRAALAAKETARKAELAVRNAVVSEMKALMEEKRKALQMTFAAKMTNAITGFVEAAPSAEQLAVLKAALEQDPKWQELTRRCLDSNAKLETNRLETTEIVRKRITPPKVLPPRKVKKDLKQ